MKKVARIALLLVLLFALLTLRLYKIDGTSMNYTLIEGDYVLCGKLFITAPSNYLKFLMRQFCS